MASFITIEQCKKVINNYLSSTGRGGFITGIVTSAVPLKISIDQRLEVGEENLYVTDNCIGLSLSLTHSHQYVDVEAAGTTGISKQSGQALKGVTLRRPLQIGDGVLLLCRPDSLDGIKYVLLDRIQSYTAAREV